MSGKFKSKKQINKIKRANNGITLLALVITIIVLLILAGVTISTLTGDNGILTQTENAKEQTEIANEKEMINLAVIATMDEEIYSELNEEKLQKELDKLTGEGKTEVSNAIDNFEVYFKESKRYYPIDKDGNIGEYELVVEISNAGDITKGGTLDGSEEKPYEINCIEDLVAFSNIINKSGMKIENGVATAVTSEDYTRISTSNVILKRDLNFQSKYSYENSERTDFGDINDDDTDGNKLITEMVTGIGFKPIGFKNYSFGGTFKGNEKSIKNIYIDYHEYNYIRVGLFGYCSGNVSDLTISGEIKGTGFATGGIVGHNGGIIENCVTKVNILSEKGDAGGIAGSNGGTIKKSINEANVVEAIYSGGIAGSNNEGTIENCVNKANIVGNTHVGGIASNRRKYK